MTRESPWADQKKTLFREMIVRSVAQDGGGLKVSLDKTGDAGYVSSEVGVLDPYAWIESVDLRLRYRDRQPLVGERMMVAIRMPDHPDVKGEAGEVA
jgi:hypothetical protein